MFKFIRNIFKNKNQNNNLNNEINNQKQILNNMKVINVEKTKEILNEYENNLKFEWPFK